MQGSKPCALPLGDAPNSVLISLESIQQRGTVDTPRDKTFQSGRPSLVGRAGLVFVCKGGEDTSAGAGQAGFGVLVQPIQCCGHLGVAFANHGQAVIAAVALEKVAYSDPG